jgi:hypothetical protein
MKDKSAHQQTVELMENAARGPVVNLGRPNPELLPIGHPDASSAVLDRFRMLISEADEHLCKLALVELNADEGESFDAVSGVLYRMRQILDGEDVEPEPETVGQGLCHAMDNIKEAGDRLFAAWEAFTGVKHG